MFILNLLICAFRIHFDIICSSLITDIERIIVVMLNLLKFQLHGGHVSV